MPSIEDILAETDGVPQTPRVPQIPHTIFANYIKPVTEGAGVEVDGLLIKDGSIGLADGTGAAYIGWRRPLVGAVLQTLQAVLIGKRVSIFEYMTEAQIATFMTGSLTVNMSPIVQAAIDSIPNISVSFGGLVIEFPPGAYLFDGQGIQINKSFVVLDGSAAQGTYFVFRNMVNTDWISFGSLAGGTRRQQIRNIGIFGDYGNTCTVTATGSAIGAVNGSSLKFVNTFEPIVQNVCIENCLCGIDVGENTNGTLLENVTVIPNQAGSVYGINWHCPSDGTYRSDVLTFKNVVVGAQWSNATCFNWQGFCNTATGAGLRLLHAGMGMRISNSAPSSQYFPEFFNVHDFEAEGFKTRAITIEAGMDFKFSGSDINNLTNGHASQGNADDHAIKILGDLSYSITRGISITNTRIGGCRKSGVYSESRDLQLNEVLFYTTSYEGSGLNPVVDLATGSQKVVISNMIAEEFGGAARASYGVRVALGATSIVIDGLNAVSVVTDAVQDNTTGEQVSVINAYGPGNVVFGLIHSASGYRTLTQRSNPGGVVENKVYNSSSANNSRARAISAVTGIANCYWVGELHNGSGTPYWNEDGGAGCQITQRYANVQRHYNAAGALYFAMGQALPNYATDAWAATGGVPLYGYYRNGGVVQQRVV